MSSQNTSDLGQATKPKLLDTDGLKIILNAIDSRFDTIEALASEINTRLQGIDERLDNIESIISVISIIGNEENDS